MMFVQNLVHVRGFRQLLFLEALGSCCFSVISIHLFKQHSASQAKEITDDCEI